MNESLTLRPIPLVKGTLNLPGSKSISNRVLLLAVLATGTTRMHNLLNSDDIHHMLKALKTLGVTYQLAINQTHCKINGLGRALFANHAPFANDTPQLFLGNAGTAMRPLTAVLCLGDNEIILTK